MSGDFDADVHHHIRTCDVCEVVHNRQGEPRILACAWWYARGMVPPWPPSGAVDGPLTTGMWDAAGQPRIAP